MYNNSEDPWCNVLKHKYNVQNSNDYSKSKVTNSSLWKAVVRTIPALLETGMWIIGDDKSIKAWEENWLGVEFCPSNSNVMIPNDLKGDYICNLVTDDGYWNINMLEPWLPA